uniref:Myocardial zonula adherens protein n=1 Tax=Amphilophus citrinellus TaxID=61819 RepID=A0A3Q0QTD1_AMPCI
MAGRERQGQVVDLGRLSKEELQELRLRQEKMLRNRKLLQTLPDKGQKIKDLRDKVCLAIEHHAEEERRQSLVSAAGTELQYQQPFANQQHAASIEPAASHQNRQNVAVADDASQEMVTSPVSAQAHENHTLEEHQDLLVSGAAAAESMETAADGASLNADKTKEGDLVEALERVTLSETTTGGSSKSKDPLKSRDNHFLRKQPPTKPHYITVLENTEKLPAPMKQKFKTNKLPHRNDTPPSGFLPPSQFFERSPRSPLSAQARRERDKKHLDDITAAKLPLLHHMPAQVISLEESAALLKEQTKKRQELQAKLAAQKLSEGLKVSMGSYTPDGGPMAAYREVHDEGAQLSSDED